MEPHEREALRGHEVRGQLASFGDGDQQRCVGTPAHAAARPSHGHLQDCTGTEVLTGLHNDTL